MREFRDCGHKEGIESLLLMRASTVILREMFLISPLSLLFEAAEAVERADMLRARDAFHAFTAELLASNVRRVSGSLLTDLLLALIIETEHPFAAAAASGAQEPLLTEAMRRELAMLQRLSGLTAEDFSRMAQEKYMEERLKPKQVKDGLSATSAALWAGTSPRPLPKAEPRIEPPPPPPPLMPMDFDWGSWSYAPAELTEEYASDEALEEVYARLLQGVPWKGAAEDLQSFFGAYGTGLFVRHRVLYWEKGRLMGGDERVCAPVSGAVNAAEHALLLENAIRFMRDEPHENMLITGPAGAGKTAEALSLPYELPELRLVIVQARECDTLSALLERLSREPLKFMVLIEGIESAPGALSALSAQLLSGRLLPDNVMLCATAREAEGEELFTLRSELSTLSLDEFTELAEWLLAARGVYADKATLRSIAVDYQMDEREGLTCRAASVIAARYNIS